MINNAFEDKRVKTFSSLKTKPTDWKHAKVKTFLYQQGFSQKSKKEIWKWIPQYNIEGNMQNPFTQDMVMSFNKRCQLCDTHIIDYGIITNENTNQYLIVGMECYEKYETDDHRKFKIRLFQQLKNEHIMKQVREQQKLITEKVIARYPDNAGNISYGDYAAYSNIIRNRWVDWGKVKVGNFIAKNANFLKALGYEFPIEVFGPNVYKQFLYSYCRSFSSRDCIMKIFHPENQKYFYHLPVDEQNRVSNIVNGFTRTLRENLNNIEKLKEFVENIPKQEFFLQFQEKSL